MNTIKHFYNWIRTFNKRRQLKKRIAELRKKDPFIYH